MLVLTRCTKDIKYMKKSKALIEHIKPGLCHPLHTWIGRGQASDRQCLPPFIPRLQRSLQRSLQLQLLRASPDDHSLNSSQHAPSVSASLCARWPRLCSRVCQDAFWLSSWQEKTPMIDRPSRYLLLLVCLPATRSFYLAAVPGGDTTNISLWNHCIVRL